MRFLCDAMLGGLAKWLRAAGYDAYYAREGTDVSDRTLTAKALAERRVLLTSDGGFLERKPVRDGSVGFLRVPHLPLDDQLRLVVEHFGLIRRQSRCMVCSGDWTPYPARSFRVEFRPAYRGITNSSFSARTADASSGTARTGSV